MYVAIYMGETLWRSKVVIECFRIDNKLAVIFEEKMWSTEKYTLTQSYI